MATTAATVQPAGFPDATRNSQAVFRALMDAFARPMRTVRLPLPVRPPASLEPALAAVALTLLDFETSVWLDDALRGAAIVDYLRFETGVKIAEEPHEAAFALIGDPARMPPFTAFHLGHSDYPDRSTTLVIAVPGFDENGWTFTGPGILDRVSLTPQGLPSAFPGWIAENSALFPLGVDCVFAAGDRIAALPRSSRLMEA